MSGSHFRVATSCAAFRPLEDEVVDHPSLWLKYTESKVSAGNSKKETGRGVGGYYQLLCLFVSKVIIIIIIIIIIIARVRHCKTQTSLHSPDRSAIIENTFHFFTVFELSHYLRRSFYYGSRTNAADLK
jgi:hypothetical protein